MRELQAIKRVHRVSLSVRLPLELQVVCTLHMMQLPHGCFNCALHVLCALRRWS
jgi:hypothetical protein